MALLPLLVGHRALLLEHHEELLVRAQGGAGVLDVLWVALLVQRYLSNAASFAFCGITCLMKLLHSSPLLKNTCVRQVVLDGWFPRSPARPGPSSCWRWRAPKLS